MNSKSYRAVTHGLYLLAATLALAGALGCEVTSEKIQNWKRSEKGPAKIRYAVQDTHQKLEVRAEAAAALGELGFFVPLGDDLKSLAPDDRKQIVAALSRALIASMKGSNARATSKVQIQAKDTLFAVRDLVDEAPRSTIDDEVVRWLLADWANRREGENSGEKIVRAVGSRAGPRLVEQLVTEPTNLLTFTTLLRDLGDPAARDAGASKLIALAKQQKPVEETTLAALGKVGSLLAVRFLAELTREGALEQRVKALQAMTGFPDRSLVPVAQSLAADTKAPAELRDEAFTLLERIHDPGALQALLGFAADKEEKVRYRVVEGVVEGFGADGLAKLLEALPPGYTYKKDDLKDLVEEEIVKLGAKALPPLRTALSSKSWIARLIAVRALSRLGSAEDVPALEKLAGDGTKLRGWEGGATVGTEANGAVAQIRGRR